MNDDTISRQAAIDAVKDAIIEAEWEHAENAIKQLPSAQKPGRWIKTSPAGIYECSECGKNVMTSDIDAYDFCHGCGAKMEVEHED